MALTSILREECPKCKKLAVEVSRTQVGSSILIKLQCGHIIAKDSIKSSSDSIYENIISSDGKHLRAYQIEAVKFLEKSNANAILGDEQGLGKTIEVLSLLRLHPEKLLSAIIVCPSTVKQQWMFEIVRWCGINKEFVMQILQTSKDFAIPGMGLYIITYDILKNDEVFQ